MSAVIKAENLGKKYIIGHQKQRYGDSLRDAMTHTARGIWQRVRHPLSPNRESVDLEELWALKDIDFEVQQGERVGIIGANGAGKSTLLKVLSRITEPTTGKVRIKGRVSSLLEVGTGFHPELTGRENIFLNGAILGMTRKEVKRKFDEIIAFAELEKFLDTPVKRYSSGMYVRLAFAVAAHLEPEILIVDEVLAVGDAAFQKKCLGKMQNVAKEGRTVLFVSHNMAAVQNLCSRGYLLDQGRIAATGEVNTIIAYYVQSLQGKQVQDIATRIDRRGNGRLRFISFSLHGVDGQSSVVCGSPVVFEIDYKGDRPLRNVNISVGIYNLLGEGVAYLSNDLTGKEFKELPQCGTFICRFSKLPLIPGMYSVNLYCTVNGLLADWIIDGARVKVAEGDYFGTGKLPVEGYGALVVDHEWDVIGC